jgi:hypothetical protein
VVVFFLVTEHGFNKRNIGLKYQITYLYVPTVVSEIEYQIKNIAGLQQSIQHKRAIEL